MDNISTQIQPSLNESHGAVMKEFVTVPDILLKDTEALHSYLEISFTYIQTLKPKPTKKKKK